MERSHPGLGMIALVLSIAVPLGCSRSTTKEPAQSAKPAAVAPAQDPAKTAAAVDGCSLLTKEEVGAAIGKPVTPINGTTGQVASCEYHNTARQPDKFLELIVYTLTPSQAKGVFEGLKGGGRDQVAVAGIGDDAYWDKTFGLSVLKGRYKIGISVMEPDVDGLKVARALAPKLLSRLP